MTTNEWLTLLAIVMGPVWAVLITLWVEKGRRVRERRMYVARMLIMTRHMVADPQYSAAINLIPIEFNDEEKVMTAWRTYSERVRVPPSTDPGHDAERQRRITVAQSGLIFEVLRTISLSNQSEGDIQSQAYVSTAFIERDKIYLDSLRALPVIAATLDQQRQLTQRIVDALPPRPPTATN